METTICIRTDFPCVFLLNGTFAESAESFSYPGGEPIYITVLPLAAHLLPYTVKLAANKPLSNEKLCAAFSARGKLCVKLFPRYNYIYSTERVEEAAVTAPERMFRAVKQKNFSAARKVLTETLSSSVNDETLTEFFDGYAQIIKDDFSRPKNSGAYFLVNADGKGASFIFELNEGLIDNIIEND